jgi:hypothetical protein
MMAEMLCRFCSSELWTRPSASPSNDGTSGHFLHMTEGIMYSMTSRILEGRILKLRKRVT